MRSVWRFTSLSTHELWLTATVPPVVLVCGFIADASITHGVVAGHVCPFAPGPLVASVTAVVTWVKLGHRFSCVGGCRSGYRSRPFRNVAADRTTTVLHLAVQRQKWATDRVTASYAR